MRVLVRTSFVAGWVCLLALAAPTANAAFPGANGKIAFHTNRDGNPEIYTMNNDGSVPTRLTNNAADDVTPAWSADGTKIVFVSRRDGNYEIYTMNADGSAQTRVTNNVADDVNPSWSPDGTKIWFTTNRDGPASNYEIYTMNADGSSPTRITNNPANDGQPEVSPDGTKVLFQTNRDGNFEIYKMNPDGSGPVNLTSNAASDLRPNWFPDGSRFVFDTDRFAGNLSIVRMNADGTNFTVVRSLETVNFFAAAMSPASTSASADYVWTEDLNGPDNDITKAGPSGPVTLTGNSVDDGYPDWQPVNRSYARPRGASPTRISLVPAYKQCPASPTPPRTHLGSISAPSCYAPTPESSYLTVGSPEFNSQQANFVGSVLFKAVTTPAANITIDVSTTDIRCQAISGSCSSGALADYTGDLRFDATFRITDKGNGPATTGPTVNGTVTDLPVDFNVPCTTTAATNTGSTCSVTTSMNSVFGSTAIVASRRAIWQMVGGVNLYDGGSDGAATTTANNTLFAVGGLFTP